MNYNLVLEIKSKDIESLYAIAKSEVGKKDRSEIIIKKKNGLIIFNILAKDIVALKASTNHIYKTIETFEKALNLVENG